MNGIPAQIRADETAIRRPNSTGSANTYFRWRNFRTQAANFTGRGETDTDAAKLIRVHPAFNARNLKDTCNFYAKLWRRPSERDAAKPIRTRRNRHGCGETDTDAAKLTRTRRN